MALQLLNASNARAAAEKEGATAAARAVSAEAEAEALRAKAEAATGEAETARQAASGAREETQEARLNVERAKLQAEQDTLAVQRQATNAVEHHLDKIRKLQDEVVSQRLQAQGARSEGAEERTSLRAELEALQAKEASLRLELTEQLAQLGALQAHAELLSGHEAVGAAAPLLADAKSDAPAAASPAPSAAPPSVSVAEAAAAVGGGHLSDREKALSSELHMYQRTVNGALQANRALHEAYWRLRSLVQQAARRGEVATLPSHVELQLGALVQPATGRREVPSESEKGMAQEKAALQARLERLEGELEEAEARWREALVDQHKGSVAEAAAEEVGRAEELRVAADARAEQLQARVAELEAGREAESNSKLVEELRGSQESLLAQIEQLRENGDNPHGDATAKSKAEAEAEVQALRHQVEELENKLAAADERAQLPLLGGSYDAQKLQLQVRELTRVQGELERERTELARRAAYAEAQLAEMQQYLGTNIGKYQKEILRLRQSLERASVGSAK